MNINCHCISKNSVYLLRSLKISAVVTLLAVAGVAKAQNDTVQAKDLGEVVVEGAQNYATSTATIYTPTGKQKNASRDAVDLLRKMAIPQLVVSPSGGVTDTGGQPISFYVNYLPASVEELDGMRMADVKVVQYLEYPTDPRFQNAPRVINYILHEYVYGGYTKLSLHEENSFVADYSNHPKIFSRFAYKKMTYDLFAGTDNTDFSRGGSFSQETYSLLDQSGKPYDVVRTLEPTEYRNKFNNYPFTFRATYSSDKVQIRNTIGYTNSSNPKSLSGGKLTLSVDPDNEFTYTNSTPNRSNSLSYNGYFFFSLPRQWSVTLQPVLSYSHTNQYSYYTTPYININRHARENALYERLDAYINKVFNGKHTVKLNLTEGVIVNSLTYAGTDNYKEKLNEYFVAGSLMYNYSNEHVSINADAGGIVEMYDINNKRTYDPYPFAHINFRYVLNPKNVFSLWFQYASSTPGLSEKTPDILQSNEFLYITGEPDLKGSRHITLNLSYTWIPSNRFSMTAYANYFEHFNRYVNFYEQYKGGAALLRKYINDGNFIKSSIGLSGNAWLIPNKLQLYAGPRMDFFRATGTLSETYNRFYAVAQLYYYLDNFYFGGYYGSPSGSLTETNQSIVKNRAHYQINAGWGNSTWHVQLSAINFFNKGWKTGESFTTAPLYRANTVSYGASSHPGIMLYASYTFGYGKRVQRGNEVGGQGGASSAILQ